MNKFVLGALSTFDYSRSLNGDLHTCVQYFISLNLSHFFARTSHAHCNVYIYRSAGSFRSLLRRATVALVEAVFVVAGGEQQRGYLSALASSVALVAVAVAVEYLSPCVVHAAAVLPPVVVVVPYLWASEELRASPWVVRLRVMNALFAEAMLQNLLLVRVWVWVRWREMLAYVSSMETRLKTCSMVGSFAPGVAAAAGSHRSPPWAPQR